MKIEIKEKNKSKVKVELKKSIEKFVTPDFNNHSIIPMEGGKCSRPNSNRIHFQMKAVELFLQKGDVGSERLLKTDSSVHIVLVVISSVFSLDFNNRLSMINYTHLVMVFG